MTDFNKTNIEMKADIPSEDAGKYIRIKAYSIILGVIFGGIAALIAAYSLL